MDANERLLALVDERGRLERRLQEEPEELNENAVSRYEESYRDLQSRLARLFREAEDGEIRTQAVLEMMRILENRLVYLHSFTVFGLPENRRLAEFVTQFIDGLEEEGRGLLSPLERIYYRAIAAMYAGDYDRAREGFLAACESEESDETNDIKFKSYVILGNLCFERSDFDTARSSFDQSLRYSKSANVTAQALALKALNAYALREHDDALQLFEQALDLFRRDEPHFNSYFYRNSILFCGLLHYEKGNVDRAIEFYERVVNEVEPESYDYFDALTRLGRIRYEQGRFDDAAGAFSRAVESYRHGENEHLVDTCFWLARSHMKRNDPAGAKPWLERVAGSDVRYRRKSEAEQLLRDI